MTDVNPGEKNNLLPTKQTELLSSFRKPPPCWGDKMPRWICMAFLATKSACRQRMECTGLTKRMADFVNDIVNDASKGATMDAAIMQTASTGKM